MGPGTCRGPAVTAAQGTLTAAQQVERDDIAALKAARNGLTAPDVKQVYTNLLAGSEHHLAAFTRWAAR